MLIRCLDAYEQHIFFSPGDLEAILNLNLQITRRHLGHAWPRPNRTVHGIVVKELLDSKNGVIPNISAKPFSEAEWSVP